MIAPGDFIAAGRISASTGATPAGLRSRGHRAQQKGRGRPRPQRSFPRRERVAVGSIKANIGHLKAVAGCAGLIKAVLALKGDRRWAREAALLPGRGLDNSLAERVAKERGEAAAVASSTEV